MPELTIEIQTNDRTLSLPFQDSTKRNQEVMPGVVYQGPIVRKGGDALSDALRFVVDTAINVEWGLLAAYLYEKVNGRAETQVVIRRRVVETVTPEGIRRVIEEEIRGPYNRD